MLHSRFHRNLLDAGILAAVYFVAGKLGLQLAFLHASATPVWPPAGIALAALLIFGYRVWPGILLGAFLVNVTTAGTATTSAGIAVGNTLEALIAAYLLNRLAGGRNVFDRSQGVLEFAVLAAIMSTAVSATFGVTSLCVGGFAPWSSYKPIWLTWWLGDAVSDLVVTPLLLFWSKSLPLRWNRSQFLEALAVFSGLLLVGQAVFGGPSAPVIKGHSAAYLCVPFLIWAAFRLGQSGAATAMFLLSGIAIWGTLQGFGPFVTGTRNESLLFLQAFMGVSSAMTLGVAAVVSERKRAEEALRRMHSELEQQVQQRTKALQAAVEQLRTDNEKFLAVAETANDAIVCADSRGTITYFNQAAGRMFGHAPEDVAGEPLTCLMPERFREAHRRGLTRLTSTGESHVLGKTVELAGRRKDGSEFPLELSLASWRTSKGTFFTGIIRDTTERKRAELRFRSLLESAPDAMVIVDAQGRIVLVNAQVERLFGYACEQLLGQSVELLVPERFRGRHIVHRVAYAANPHTRAMGARLELYGLRKDRTEFPVEISLSPLQAEEGLLITAAIRDITERKQAAEALERQASELAHSNAELTAINKELDAFTYSVSHDLRAPLRQIDGFSRIVLEEFGPGLVSPGQHCVKRIQDGVRQMARLLDDLLNLGRLGRAALHLQPVELKELVRQVVAELEPETKGRHIEWRIGELPCLECDPGLMKLVFSNLLSNAAKYTRLQKLAVIQVDRTVKDGELVIFVRDNGVGFNMRYVHKLFGIFQRLHLQEEFEGNGVGLASVQRIIHKHGGRIWAEAEPYKGATFSFTLAAGASSKPETRATVGGGAWRPT